MLPVFKTSQRRFARSEPPVNPKKTSRFRQFSDFTRATCRDWLDSVSNQPTGRIAASPRCVGLGFVGGWRLRAKLLLTLTLCVGCAGDEAAPSLNRGTPRRAAELIEGRSPNFQPRFIELNLEGPSSIAYHPARQTLLVASDAGYVAEFDRNLRLQERYELGGDLEGLAVHPLTGNAFVASEREGALLEFSLEKRKVLRTFVIDYESDRRVRDEESDNSGIEGITFLPTASGTVRLFTVMQADPARLIELSAAGGGVELTKRMRSRVKERLAGPRKHRGEIETLHITGVTKLEVEPLSDVVYSEIHGALVVISARRRQALLLQPDTRAAGGFELPGRKPEGLAFLRDGQLVVVDDEGGAWWIDDASAWIEQHATD